MAVIRIEGQSSDGAVVHTQCGNNCTSNDDCEAPASSAGVGGIAEKGSNCTCRAQSSQYQPGPGTVAFVAACLIDMATGGKREESLPCPCNSTYVSHGCCGAKNGWISEAPAYKLGGTSALANFESYHFPKETNEPIMKTTSGQRGMTKTSQNVAANWAHHSN